MKKEIALTIKPTMSCNMRCKHCFNGNDLKDSSILPVSAVLKFIELACRDYEIVKITFHGGEPSLAGIDYYKTVFSFQKKMEEVYGTKFHNNFTTNGLLLNEEYIDLLVSNRVMVNLSFDGPYNHILRQQTEKVYQKIGLLKYRGARFRVFCTISEPSYRNLTEIYKWFNERGVDFKILPIEKRGYAKENSELVMDRDDFVEELTKTYRYWIKDKNCQITFYTFEEFAVLKSNIQFKPYWFNRKLALNPDGFIYPFGRPNDIHFILGRPEEIESLEQCFHSGQYSRLREILNNYHESVCKGCGSLHICNGVAVCMSYMYVDQMDLLRYSCSQSDHIFSSILKINDEIKHDFMKGDYGDYGESVKKAFSEYLPEANEKGIQIQRDKGK